ncbi:hypothetical protein [Acidomonas methanolica]|uniref:hypothetical protein n=1 Tax=Acidomonas methanolica TaxID=437 RepID=UPI00211A627C|nr:hypothetical protein [Acidomonas methanolica]MCQ9156178.1 hypothetical protein [Acidomonas methanolica]
MENSPDALQMMLRRFAHGVGPMGDCVGRQTPKRKSADTPPFGEEWPVEGPAAVYETTGFTGFAPGLRSMIGDQEEGRPVKRSRKARPVAARN